MKVKISISKYMNIYIWVSINYHPYSIHSGYHLFFESTIMGGIAGLTMVQKKIIDTLHKEGKSKMGHHWKRVAVQWVLYQSISNAMLTGRKMLGRKMCTSNRDDRKLENTVKQSWFKHLRELHKEWTEAGVSASRVNTLRHLQEKGYQATCHKSSLSGSARSPPEGSLTRVLTGSFGLHFPWPRAWDWSPEQVSVIIQTI